MTTQWQVLTLATRQAMRACRVAVVEGPAHLVGTCMALGSMGEVLSVSPGELVVEPDLAVLGREALIDGRPRMVTVGPLRAYAEPLLPPPHLIVAGAGHVGAALVPAAMAAGFRVTVVDDRPGFAVAERFPGATVLCEDMAAALERLHTDDTTFLVLAGRSHELDREALRVAVQKPVAYVGMVGSRRKVTELQRQLLQSHPLQVGAFERLRAPIGLDLGAETPGEIAVAIVAEMVAVRRGGSGVPLAQAVRVPERNAPVSCGTVEAQRVWLSLAEAMETASPCALATIVQARGSTPRNSGTSMLVLGDGRTVGTVGGGKWEAEIQRQALASLETGRPVLLHTNYVDEADMICGGAAEVFIEPVVPLKQAE